MNIELLNNSFDSFLKHKSEKVLLVKGPWGIGKTYYINKNIEKFSGEFKSINISLFGLHKIEDLRYLVTESILNKLIAKPINDGIKTLISIPFISKFIPQEIPSLEKINEMDSLAKVVIFFDDLERTNIGIKDFFGYIDQIKNTSTFKVVVALNDKQIEGQEIWNLKEKVSDKEVRLINTFEHVIESVYGNDSEFALIIFRGLNVVNLRVILKSYQIMNLFVKKTTGLNEENTNKLKASCLCLSAKYYSSESFNESNLTNIRQYDNYFLFNSIINSYLDSQIINDDLINRILQSTINQQKENDNNDSFYQIIKLIEESFSDNSLEVIKLANDFVRKSISDDRQLLYMINIINKLEASIPRNVVESWFNGEIKRSNFFTTELIDIYKNNSEYDFLKNYITQDEIETYSNDDSTNDNSGLICAYLIQASQSKLSFFESDLSSFSSEEWLDFITQACPRSIFIDMKDELMNFITSDNGKNLKTAINVLIKTPIQKIRLNSIFGEELKQLIIDTNQK